MMQDNAKLEELVKVVYKKYKAHLPLAGNAHPDEESMACFLQGSLSQKEASSLKRHLTACEVCAEIFSAAHLKLEAAKELEVPEGLILRVKKMAMGENKEPVLEILLKLKAGVFELIKTSGDVLVGQELVPAPILRSRKIKDFKDEITILKDFEKIRVELRLENKGLAMFAVHVLVKEKKSARPVKDLRVTLLRQDLELESYITDSGRVIFDNVQLGKYTVEILNIENKFAAILLDINA